MPDANCSVVQHGQQMRAVGGEGHSIHGGSWLSQRQNFTSGGNVPEIHGLFIIHDSQSATVRKNGQRLGWLRIWPDAECPRLKTQRRYSRRTLETDR